jgi:hypothetical protein
VSRVRELLAIRSAVPAAVSVASTVAPRAASPRWDVPVWVRRAPAVGKSSDLDRVAALPRRPAFDESHDYSALVEELTAAFRRPNGTMTLLPAQAFSLSEARSVGGLVGLLAVGSGKTLLSLLLPVAFGAKRTVLLLPPQLKAQLVQTSFPELSKHWRIPNVVGGVTAFGDTDAVIYPVAYSELSSLKRAGVLEALQPDCIVADEAHNLRRTESARTDRFLRYVIRAAKAGSLKHLALLSGTLAQRSIEDLRFICYALGKYAPIPWDVGTLKSWAAALDPVDEPAESGALDVFCDPGESVRTGFQRRLVETPGVVATRASAIATRHVFTERAWATPPAVTEALANMRRTWVTPWGEAFDTAIEFSRYARQMATGLLYRRVWPRGEPETVRKEWLEARAEWNSEVRDVLSRPRRDGMDSPQALELAAKDGRWRSRTWARWEAVRELAKPENEPYWVDDGLVKDAIAWGREHRGLIWYSYEALGERIAREGGFPWVAGGDEGDEALRKLDGSQSVVISRPSRETGTDGLQRLYSEQLVTTPSSAGARWEQLLGRLHRLGQSAPVVTTWVYRHTPELRSAFEAALEEAKFAQEVSGNEQKLSLSEYSF